MAPSSLSIVSTHSPEGTSSRKGKTRSSKHPEDVATPQSIDRSGFRHCPTYSSTRLINETSKRLYARFFHSHTYPTYNKRSTEHQNGHWSPTCVIRVGNTLPMHQIRVRIVVLLLFLIVLVGQTSIQAQGNDGGNSENNPGSKIWERPRGDKFTSPVVAEDHLFIGNLKQVVSLKTSSGKENWSQRTSAELEAAPSFAGEMVFAANIKGDVFALASDTGEIRWDYNGRTSTAPPAISDGRVFVATRSGLLALDVKSGEKLWIAKSSQSFSDPTACQGRVYAGTDVGTLYAINAKTGTPIWSFETSDEITSAPAVDGNRVYFESNDKTVYALNKNSGDKNWTFQTGASFLTAPAVSRNRLFFGTSEKKLYALDADSGNKHWEFQTGGVIHSSPAVLHNRVYVRSDDGNFHAIDTKSGNEIWNYSTGAKSKQTSSPAVSGGQVYFVESEARILYALASNDNATCAAWPMFGQNPLNTNAPPALTEKGRDAMESVRTSLNKNKLQKARAKLQELSPDVFVLQGFAGSLLEIAEQFKSGNPGKALQTWNRTSHDIQMYHPDQTVRLIRALHNNPGLREYLAEQNKTIINESATDRNKALRRLDRAGLMALPVLRELRDAGRNIVKNKVRKQIQELKNHWPQFFAN